MRDFFGRQDSGHICSMAHINLGKASASETGSKGEFKRRDSAFRSPVKVGSEHPPEGMSNSSTCSRMLTSAMIRLSSLHRRLMHIPRILRCNCEPFTEADLLSAAGRYHLYISYACPWANRTLAALKMKVIVLVIRKSLTLSHCKLLERF